MFRIALTLALLVGGTSAVLAQPKAKDGAPVAAPKGSIVEDQAAKKLIEAGDASMFAGASLRALELLRHVAVGGQQARSRDEKRTP